MPSLAALTFIGTCAAMFAWLVPPQHVPLVIWPFVFLALAAGAVFSWLHQKAPQTPSGWLMFVVVAITAAAFLGLVDALFYGLASSHVILDLFAAGCGVIIAVAGALRSLLLGQKNDV